MKNAVYIYLILISLFLSCSINDNGIDQEEDSVQLKDGIGRLVSVPVKVKRVFALSPALTEMLFFICPDSIIMARTQACNYPEKVFTKPIVNTYPLDIEKILSLNPDLVLTEEGISSPDQIEMLKNHNVNVYSFRYSKVENIFEAMHKIAEICNCKDEAKTKIRDLQERLNAIVADQLGSKKVLGLIWKDPIYVYGKNTLFSDQLELIGLENAVDSVFKQAYPEISREYFLKINPDIIIGSSFPNLDSSLFKRYPELKRTNAYMSNKIFDIDDDILTRPGPRSVLAIQLIKDSIKNE